MLRVKSEASQSRRRAAILMVTIVLLTLFLAIGLMFVLFAESQATSSRIYREASLYLADTYPLAEPEELFGWALGELIYDSQDGYGGVSATYGHGLARNMYGWNYMVVTNPDGTQSILAHNPATNRPINETPFNGAGRPASLRNEVNYQTQGGIGRQPEWLNATGVSCDIGQPLFYTGGFNAPYTYPDLNNVYLASVLADGTVLKPSFWPGDLNGLGPADPANPNLTNPAYQRYSLRPLNAPTLHPNFPTIGVGGDVRNRPLGWGPTGNDSVWIDMGYPAIRLAASGRLIKPMFAILMIDMDGRINLNQAGNLRGSPSSPPYPPAMGGVPPSDTHTSLQGWGRTEINPRWLGNFDTMTATNMTEYQRLFWGDSTIGLPGKYGVWAANNMNGQPKPTPTHPNTRTTGGAWPRVYAQGDWDGARLPIQSGGNMPGPIDRMLIPANYPGAYFSALPFFGAPTNSRFGNGADFEANAHPFLFNPFMLNRFGSVRSSITDDRIYPISDLRWLLAFNDPAEVQNAELYKIAPTFMGNARQRNMITPYSVDFDLMGAAPGQPSGSYFMPNPLDPSPISPNRIPQGPTTSFTSQLATRGANPNPGGDFVNNDWRSQLASIGRVDLNRRLAAYPSSATGGQYYAGGPNNLQFRQAVAERVYLAREIFTRLKFATGVQPLTPADYPANTTTAGSAAFETHRFLAQLAVNMVDYIDDDEFSTPFNWDSDQFAASAVTPTTWVFGTELPRLVINEVYAQATNRLGDQLNTSRQFTPGADLDPDTLASQAARPFMNIPPAERPTARATQEYQINFFVELHNPHNTDPNHPGDNGGERVWLDQAGTSPYRIVIRSPELDMAGNPVRSVRQVLDQVWNVTGDPSSLNSPRIDRTVTSFAPANGGSTPTTNFVMPANGQYGDRTTNNAGNNGYYVVGPAQAGLPAPQARFYEFPFDRSQGSPPGVFGTFTATMANDQLIQYIPNTTPTAAFDPQDPNYATESPKYRPTVVLQRLANPYLPPNPDPTQGTYNPYVTVDYVENIPIHDGILATPGGLRDGTSGPQNDRTPVEQRMSVGRRQPFRARGVCPQQPLEAQGMGPPAALPYSAQHTFFRQNGQSLPASPAPDATMDYPFDWLTHLDRVLINPAELLHVCALRPHDLTHYFINDDNPAMPDAGTKNMHSAYTLFRSSTVNSRLYRALELLGTRDRIEASPFGGRVMGKVNINTITEAEVFRAVCDAALGNYFDAATVNNVWNAIRTRRSPMIAPSASDRPFWSLAMPNDTGTGDAQYHLPANPGGHETGILGTTAGTPLCEVPPGATVPTHPYIQSELLQKIMGHLTTRSNVFAVWITTGFFEVEDAFQQPPRIGREVDVRMRHKFFAVIDRTNLTLDWANPRAQGPRPIFFPFTPADPNDNLLEPNGALGVTIRVPNVLRTTGVGPAAIFTLYDSVAHGDQDYLSAGAAPPYTYDIKLNDYLVIGTGDNKEIVRIIGLNALNHTITVQTNFRHYAGEAVCTQRIGNPGPQPLPIDYSAPKYSGSVVPYYVILQ